MSVTEIYPYNATNEELEELRRTPLEWINCVAEDRKHKDQISVISLPPGAGKSTAASAIARICFVLILFFLPFAK